MKNIEFDNDLVLMRNQLFSKAMSLSVNRQDAEDLTHEAIEKAIFNKAKFRKNDSLKAWVFTILKNQFVNRHRRNRQLRAILKSAEKRGLPFVYNSGNYAAEADSALMTDDVQNMINRLGPKYSGPLNDYINGYKYKEISDRFKLPIGTIKSRIFYARKMIAEMRMNETS
ncbi:MAG: RNA polymerase sigma factor [Bacteroidales bacterium]|nr:RNA polymerase sigma factor [Bacteroidales bacterium]HQP03298.1 RNA polymerase sigma factor [Bacteroidales bacterium]